MTMELGCVSFFICSSVHHSLCSWQTLNPAAYELTGAFVWFLHFLLVFCLFCFEDVPLVELSACPWDDVPLVELSACPWDDVPLVELSACPWDDVPLVELSACPWDDVPLVELSACPWDDVPLVELSACPWDDVPLVELMYLAFTCTPGESYWRRLGSSFCVCVMFFKCELTPLLFVLWLLLLLCVLLLLLFLCVCFCVCVCVFCGFFFFFFFFGGGGGLTHCTFFLSKSWLKQPCWSLMASTFYLSTNKLSLSTRVILLLVSLQIWCRLNYYVNDAAIHILLCSCGSCFISP